jgi:hypothetical protein
MRRTRLFCAIGVSVWSVVITLAQAPPEPLSNELRTVLRDGRFDTVTSIRGLPLGVRDALRTLFGSQTLDIAEPGEPFQPTGASGTSALPPRRLVAAGCTSDRCLVYYERGGTSRTRRVALFHWTPALTQVEWGALAPGGLATIDAVRKAILSGAIKEPAKSW